MRPMRLRGWLPLVSAFILLLPLALAAAAPALAQTPAPTPMPPAPSMTLPQPLPQQSYLPLDLALKAANSALAACEQGGYKVSVTVVDQDGVQKVVLKSDGAGPHTLSSSFKKAFTSASLGRPTQDLTSNPNASQLQNMDSRILILGGGLPIRVENQLVGAIGVGGTPSGLTDQSCAQAGLDALK